MATKSFSHGHSAHHIAGHEHRDASVGWVFGVVGFLFVSGLLMHLFLGGFMKTLGKTPLPSDRWQPNAKPRASRPARDPFPYLQVAPPMDWTQFRAREAAELNRYSWVNKTAGVVHVPIDRAMTMLLEKGLPAREGTNENKLAPSSLQLQQERALNRGSDVQGSK